MSTSWTSTTLPGTSRTATRSRAGSPSRSTRTRWPWLARRASIDSTSPTAAGERRDGGERHGAAAVSRAAALLLAAALLGALCFSGCGYTVLKGAAGEAETAPAPGSDASATREGELPPGHPPIESPEDWIGRSFLDDLLGEEDPLRFENMRAEPGAGAPGGKAIITVRMLTGDPALADVWQIRMDVFGWVTAAYWAQGAAGPRRDDLLATRRAEFRLDPASESALRSMAMTLFPASQRPARVRTPEQFPRIPPQLWPHDDPGLLEIDYRIETIDRADPADWPGGQVTVPLDLVQLLIVTWDDLPPLALRRAVRDLAARQSQLLHAALLAEGLVLALEVEGPQDQQLGLPLRVGR